MQDGNFYPPINVRGLYPILWLSFITLCIATYFFVRWLRKYLAHKAQKRLATIDKPNAEALINQAMAEIDAIHLAAQNGQITYPVAAERLSYILRNTFDTLMSHQTLRQAKYEVLFRHLTNLGNAMSTSYHVEFSREGGALSHISLLCQQAKEVLNQCR